MAVIIKRLSFSYHGRPPLAEDASFEASDGECVAVTGPNGCGKSTFISLLAGIAAQTRSISVSGQISGLPDNGTPPVTLLQNPDLQLLSAKAGEELDFFLKYSSFGQGKNSSELARRAGITALLDKPVTKLSSGEKQRLALTAALACADNRVVLLDEPTNGLDNAGRAMLRNAIKQLKLSGSAVIMAGHEFEGVDEVIDRYVSLRGGKFIPAGAPPPFSFSRDKNRSASPLMEASGITLNNGTRISSAISLRSGITTGILGPNGCGKSLLCRALAGLNKQFTGAITIKGEKTEPEELRETVKLLPSNPFNTLLYRTVRENLLWAEKRRRNAILPPEDITVRMGVDRFINMDIAELSYGQAQRTALACGFIKGPDILIADEALAPLDQEGLYAFAGLAEIMTKSGGSVAVVSHVREITDALCEAVQEPFAEESCQK